MPIDPVKIPQNVYIEDRIVGPLTLRQILTVALGGGLSYVLYIMAQKAAGGNPGLIITIVLWIPGVLSIILAFVTVNDLSIVRLILLTFERLNKPRIRTFEPRTGISVNIKTAMPEPEKKAAPPMPATNFADLSAVLDRSPATALPVSASAEPASIPIASALEPGRARSSLLSTPPSAAPILRDLSAT